MQIPALQGLGEILPGVAGSGPGKIWFGSSLTLIQLRDPNGSGRGRFRSRGRSSLAIFLRMEARRSFPSRSARAAARRRYSTLFSVPISTLHRWPCPFPLSSLIFTLEQGFPFHREVGADWGVPRRDSIPHDSLAFGCPTIQSWVHPSTRRCSVFFTDGVYQGLKWPDWVRRSTWIRGAEHPVSPTPLGRRPAAWLKTPFVRVEPRFGGP